MLGKGWFPDQVGGLDRFFRDLLEHQPEAVGVVIGPAGGQPERVVAVSRDDAPLPWRLLAFALAARTGARHAAVIDSHFALYAALPMLFSRRVRALATVVHFQGPWAQENVAQGDGSRVRQTMRRGIERAVYRRAGRVVVLSSAFRRLLVEGYGVSPWRVCVHPPGVDLQRFAPGDRLAARERLGLQGVGFVATCVRRLVPRMGIDLLIDAWAHALADLPAGARLLIAGDGPQRDALQARIERLALSDDVRLLGAVSDDALADLYRAADVGIVPTRAFEGFGLVVIEAAACGTPTIVTSVGGLPEAVAGLDPSLGVVADDKHALAMRIVDAAQPGGLPSRDATRLFAERFSWARAVSRTREVQQEALAPAAGRRRMRVVYLDHVAQLSGGEIALLRLVPHLDDVDAHFVLAEDGPFADALVQAGMSIEVLPMGESARGLRKDSAQPGMVPLRAVIGTSCYIVRLGLHLRRLQPDIVHTNSLKAGVYGSIAARLARVPVVWHVRDRIATDYLPRPAMRLIRFMTRRLTAAVIANSRATMTTLAPAARPASVYSILPEALIAPARVQHRTPSAFTVGMIGRLTPWKGQDLFLRAFAQAFPDGEERCVLVGAPLFGEDGFERDLRVLAADLGLGGRVEFRGFRIDIWSELARMDALVHASLIPEPFGQVVLEAMAARVPVIAADAGAPAELIEAGVNGVLYPMGDQTALASAMRRLSGCEQTMRFVEAGIETVAAYHPDVIGARLQAIYRDVIAPHAEPR